MHARGPGSDRASEPAPHVPASPARNLRTERSSTAACSSSCWASSPSGRARVLTRGGRVFGVLAEGAPLGVHSLPGFQLLYLCGELGSNVLDRVAAQEESERRIVGFSARDDGLGTAGWVSRLATVGRVVLLSAAPGRVVVVGDHGPGLLEGTAGEVGSECARFDDENLDAKRTDLSAQCVRHALERELRCRVVPGSRLGATAGDGGDVDDGAVRACREVPP